MKLSEPIARFMQEVSRCDRELKSPSSSVSLDTQYSPTSKKIAVPHKSDCILMFSVVNN
jgi:hypothetical protein